MKWSRRSFVTGLAATTAFDIARSKVMAQPTRPRRVLLAHGVLGFSRIGSIRYFNGVADCFDKNCEFITPQVVPTGTINERAQQLRDAILHSVPANELKSGGGGIHIVAHSMGGLDARYLISKNGLDCASWFASVTTISTPHRGTRLADIMTGEQPLKLTDFKQLDVLLTPKYWTEFFRTLGKPVSSASLSRMFSESDFKQTADDLRNYLDQVFGNKAAFQELTTASTAKFNQTHPGWEGIPLLSYAGASSPDDTMSSELYAPWAILKSTTGNNDGLVPQSSSSWPQRTDQVIADHFEQVGLASYFDGSFGLRKHFPVCDLYRQIDSWQSGLS